MIERVPESECQAIIKAIGDAELLKTRLAALSAALDLRIAEAIESVGAAPGLSMLCLDCGRARSRSVQSCACQAS